MGTRSLTKVFEDGRAILCMYRQMDGYPSGHGKELSDFLNSGKLVNGIGSADKGKVFNGIGCLAAQMVMEFKTTHGVGGIYIQHPETVDAGQDYEYHIYGKWPKLGMGAQDIDEIKVFGGTLKDVVFTGSLKQYTAWVAKQK